jgi:hypothetical protein
MTLTRLLEVSMKFLKPDEVASIGMAERIWREDGGPTGIRELTDLLERTITECRQSGIRYAPILLQRKKALQRGTWSPEVDSVAVGPKETGSAVDDGRCAKCAAPVTCRLKVGEV